MEAGVPNIVYSGLVSMSALTNGRLKAYDFDRKSYIVSISFPLQVIKLEEKTANSNFEFREERSF